MRTRVCNIRAKYLSHPPYPLTYAIKEAREDTGNALVPWTCLARGASHDALLGDRLDRSVSMSGAFVA